MTRDIKWNAPEPGYVPFGYSDLAKGIESLANELAAGPASEMAIVLRHYVEMLRRRIVPDEELREFARQIYERHKEAFEFVIECRPEPDSLLGVVQPLIEAEPEIVPDRHGRSVLRFVPERWSGSTPGSWPTRRQPNQP